MNKDKKFSMKKPLEKQDDIHNKVDSAIDKLRRLDKNNPLERAIKFDKVKKYPPKPGYMKVDVYEGEDDNGNRVAISESKDNDGNITKYANDPIFSVDLKTGIDADVAACPSNVMPMLIDEYVQVAMDEKKVFKPEKRRDEFNWWWIVFFLLMIPGIITVIILFM